MFSAFQLHLQQRQFIEGARKLFNPFVDQFFPFPYSYHHIEERLCKITSHAEIGPNYLLVPKLYNNSVITRMKNALKILIRFPLVINI